MRNTNIKVATDATTDDEYLLIATNDAFEYDESGSRTTKVLGTTYRCVLPKRGFDSLNVKILGKPCMVQAPEDGSAIPVRFEGLTLTLYRTDSGYDVSARADNVSVISNSKA